MLAASVALSTDGFAGSCVCGLLVVSGIVSPVEQATTDRVQTSAKMIESSFFIELPPIICGNSTIS